MALAAYQELLCRLVASPSLRARLLERPGEVMDGLALTERERRRLVSIAAQPGIAVATAIHRANRISPIDHTLPLTCFLLRERLKDVLESYWAANPMENLQLPAECERFAAWLEAHIRAGAFAPGPYLEEVLRFERVCTELRFFTEGELRDRAPEPSRLLPQVRVVVFRHDPEIVLESLAERRMPPEDCPRGEYPILIDARSGDLEFRLLDERGRAAIG